MARVSTEFFERESLAAGSRPIVCQRHLKTIDTAAARRDPLLHPLVLVAMILALILILFLPRKYVVAPLVFLAFLTPLGQQLYIAGVHLFVLRIVILVAFIRAFASHSAPREPRFTGGWNGIDTAFTVYVLAEGIAVVLLFRDTGSLINQVGYLWDFLLGYFALRFLIRNEEDMFIVLKCLAVVTVPLAIGMIIEQRNVTNIFGMLGGVRWFLTSAKVRFGRRARLRIP